MARLRVEAPRVVASGSSPQESSFVGLRQEILTRLGGWCPQLLEVVSDELGSRALDPSVLDLVLSGVLLQQGKDWRLYARIEDRRRAVLLWTGSYAVRDSMEWVGSQLASDLIADFEARATSLEPL